MIDPMPPVGRAPLPWDALGATFALESGAMTYLFVFSASGVEAFYDIAESEASKGIADMRMLSRKVPADLFFDRRTIPHDMFTRELAESYVANVGDALDVEVALLGDAGEIDVFDLTRRLGHRFGLASWGGTRRSTPATAPSRPRCCPPTT